VTKGARYWHWDFNNDGKFDSYNQNQKYTFTRSGSYTVRLDVSCGGSSGWKKVYKVVTV
jgi:PKD repeat protein